MKGQPNTRNMLILLFFNQCTGKRRRNKTEQISRWQNFSTIHLLWSGLGWVGGVRVNTLCFLTACYSRRLLASSSQSAGISLATGWSPLQSGAPSVAPPPTPHPSLSASQRCTVPLPTVPQFHSPPSSVLFVSPSSDSVRSDQAQ